MKTQLLLPVLLLSYSLAAQPCLPDGIAFTNQQQIDDFPLNYPGCTEIGGTVEISGADIADLSGLSAVTHIGGALLIYSNYILPNLEGLNSLAKIDGNLLLWSNDLLGDMSGLNSLARVVGDVGIGVNLNTCFCPIGNASLTSFNGLENLQTIEGGLYIYKNPLLATFEGLNNLDSIGGTVSFADNTILTDLSGLENLETIGGNFGIGLHTLELPHGNPALSSLHGLENLKAIGGGFSIIFNQALTDLSALNHPISIVSDLRIEKNSLLSDCAVQAVCDFLANPPGWPFISENTGNCLSQEEVESACFVGTEESGLQPDDILLSPNPNCGVFEITGLEGMEGHIYLRNASGQLTLQTRFTGNTRLDGGTFAKGVYFLEIHSGKGAVVKKVVLE